MNKALEILEDIRETKWCGVKPTCQNYSIADFDEAIAEIKVFQQKCNELAIDAKKLADETLDLGTIIIQQKIRIAELEEMEPKTCANCRKKLLCKMADRAKLEFGTKLKEMWFHCHESKDES